MRDDGRWSIRPGNNNYHSHIYGGHHHHHHGRRHHNNEPNRNSRSTSQGLTFFPPMMGKKMMQKQLENHEVSERKQVGDAESMMSGERRQDGSIADPAAQQEL